MNMSNYNYADGATHNDHHKEMTINVSGKTDIAALMKAFMADDAEEAEVVSADDTNDDRVPPEVLCTPDAEALCNKLVGAGIVDEKWQPLALSNAEKGTLVEYIADKLNIRNKWKLFGTLWKVDAETLRTAKARGLDQDKTWEFRNKLNSL